MNDQSFFNSLSSYTNNKSMKYDSIAWLFMESIVKELGLGIIVSDSREYRYGYQNNIIRIKPDKRAVYDLIHELCHWLVCTPKRRKMIEFGLGKGFSTDDVYLESTVSKRLSQFEEDCACILSFILLREYNMNVADEMKETEFERDFKIKDTKIFNFLRKYNIIDKDYYWTGNYRC